MGTYRADRRSTLPQRNGLKGGARLRWQLSLTVLVLAALLGGATSAQAMTQGTIKDVRFGDHGTFERAVIDLGPATLASNYSSSYRKGGWVVRVELPTVDSTLTTGGKGLNKAISRYYVVRSSRESRGMFVDFHLRGAAKSVKVFELKDPARIVVDVTPGATVLYPRPRATARTVLMQPRAGKEVGPQTFVVSGYGRPFEARGAWRIKDASGSVVRRGTYVTCDWSTAWGAFRFEASYPRTLGGHRGTLEVGGFSSRDGHFEDVSVPLRFR